MTRDLYIDTDTVREIYVIEWIALLLVEDFTTEVFGPR